MFFVLKLIVAMFRRRWKRSGRGERRERTVKEICISDPGMTKNVGGVLVAHKAGYIDAVSIT